MSASVPNVQIPTIAASHNATPATASSPGSSANVAAGSAQPTAPRSYASATKKASSPPIASSAAPPVAVGGPQNAQHGKRASVSPVNGKNPIQPAVPAMAPTIVNSSSANGAPSQADHSRKSSVTISAAGTSGNIANGGPVANRPPSGLTFGAMTGSPMPAHAAPAPMPQNAMQVPNPRVASPAHSPSPIPQLFSGGKPADSLPHRPNLSFHGGSESEPNARPISLPPQSNPHSQPQHLRRESSQSGHDLNNPPYNRGYPNGGRGRGFTPGYNSSPQLHRPVPHQPRVGGPMPPSFQPQPMPNSPYRQNRSPAMTPAQIHHQQQAAQFGNPYYSHPGGFQQPGMYGAPMDPYQAQYYPQNYGMSQSMYAPALGSPGRGAGFSQMQPPYMAGYGQPPQPTSMSRTPSNMSERPPSAVAQPSTPSMASVSHVPHASTPSVPSSSPAPSSNFVVPQKKASKAIVIKKPDGEVIDFNKKAASPAPPKSPVVVATPTPPPRAPSAAESVHSRTESAATKTDDEKKAEFQRQLQEKLKLDKEKEDAEKKKADDEDRAKSAAAEKEAKEKAEAEEAKAKADAEEKAAAEAKAKAEAEAEAKKKQEEEDLERMIAEMEAAEKEEEERERKFAEKKAKEAEEAKAKEAERIKAEEEAMRKAEAEAEAREEARSKETESDKAANAALFAALKPNTQFGPSATAAATDSGASTPQAELSEPAPSAPSQPKAAPAAKSRPAALKLATQTPVEPSAPTPGMMSLKSARFLQVKNDAINYPEGIKSPNPALNVSSKSKGRQYDKDFLLQFQDVFKEKPSVDWDMKLKETVGDSTDSARPQSARTSGMGPRTASRPGVQGGPMGTFGAQGGFRTLPPGTTSQQRFEQSSRAPMTNPLASLVGSNRGSAFPMAPPMQRQSSFQNMGQAGPNSPRIGSSRGRGSRRGDKGVNRREDEQAAKAMPLTAGQEVKSLERSQTGWKPHSQAVTPQMGAGHMPPDMVQRKVKAALNKMTPEKFDKISDQILEIAAQSKDETDGRTLRQVIQLLFEKACDEAYWSSMYAKFALRMLQTMSADIRDENVTDKHGNPVVGGALFRKYLLNRCQEEFERGWEVNLPAKPEGSTEEAALLSDDYYIAAAAKRRGLGLIQFIGELYKLGMLTLRIMHECVLKLLDFEGQPDESAIESLVKLIRTVGATMEASESGPKMIAMYFERINKITEMPELGSRLKFALMDIIDLRKAGWRSKDDAKGPKTIAEVRQEAAAAQQAAEMERSRSNQRGGPRPHMGGRGDNRSFSGNMGPPPDYPSGRVLTDDLRKLSKGASGRNLNNSGSLGPSMLGPRSGSGRRGLGPGGLMNRGDESGASSRTATPPVQKEKESTTHMNSFSALAALENHEGAGEVGSPPSNTSSPPAQKSVPATTNA